jgi:hypothetical protein
MRKFDVFNKLLNLVRGLVVSLGTRRKQLSSFRKVNFSQVLLLSFSASEGLLLRLQEIIVVSFETVVLLLLVVLLGSILCKFSKKSVHVFDFVKVYYHTVLLLVQNFATNSTASVSVCHTEEVLDTVCVVFTDL